MNKRYDKRAPKEFGTVVKAKPGEHPDRLLARFKRMCKNSGLQNEIRERALGCFKTKSEKKRDKVNRAKRRILKESI